MANRLQGRGQTKSDSRTLILCRSTASENLTWAAKTITPLLEAGLVHVGPAPTDISSSFYTCGHKEPSSATFYLCMSDQTGWDVTHAFQAAFERQLFVCEGASGKNRVHAQFISWPLNPQTELCASDTQSKLILASILSDFIALRNHFCQFLTLKIDVSTTL